jgi:hypothetical protein
MIDNPFVLFRIVFHARDSIDAGKFISYVGEVMKKNGNIEEIEFSEYHKIAGFYVYGGRFDAGKSSMDVLTDVRSKLSVNWVCVSKNCFVSSECEENPLFHGRIHWASVELVED